MEANDYKMMGWGASRGIWDGETGWKRMITYRSVWAPAGVDVKERNGEKICKN